MPTAKLPHLDMAYEITGDGPPLMLVAGTAYAGGTWWPEAIDTFAQRFTVITFDHRGTGATPGTDGLYSTRMMAEDAAMLLDHLDLGPAHVAGHSMGGRVAQWIALDRPDVVRTLVLLASGPGEFPGQFEPGMWMVRGLHLSAMLNMLRDGYEAYFENYIKISMLTEDFQESQPELARKMIDHVVVYRPTVEEYLKHSIARQQHQTNEYLDRFVSPVLVVVGEDDRDVGGTGSHWQQSMHLHQNIPGSDLLIVPGAHGFLWQHANESATRIGDWLVER